MIPLHLWLHCLGEVSDIVIPEQDVLEKDIFQFRVEMQNVLVFITATGELDLE